MSTGKYSLSLIMILFFSSCIQEYVVNSNDNANENFALLWKTVDENYCFFDDKGVNWDSIKSIYEPLVKAECSDETLFGICASMLNELKDGHVNLYSDFNSSRYWDWFLNYSQNFNWPLVERNYLGKDCIIAGRLKAKKLKNIGYLRFESFSDNITYENVKGAINQLGDINGLIIDVRDNGGGYIKMAKEFATCFFTSKTLVAYIRYKEGPGHSDFSDYFPQYIEPDSSVVFNGKIVVLTNRLLFSSANYFVSMMNTLPNVTIVGDVTGGGSGLPFSSELYNGWKVRISRNPIYDINKMTIENGILPDFHINMKAEDEEKGIDSIIEFGLNYIDGNEMTE
jgi:hypothetical protein